MAIDTGLIFGSGALYKVEWWLLAEECSEFRSFEGDHAFSAANSCYDQLHARKDVRELWFTRLDGGNWVFVSPPVIRDSDGTWVTSRHDEA
jgi:hypothetical protein